MTADEPSPETLQTIWHTHGLGTIEHLAQPSGGMVNRAWMVNDAYVIRFDVLDWGGINRYAGEKWAYDLLRGSDVPVPEVIALDTSRTLVPYDYLILTKMPGATITRSLADLSAGVQHRLAYTAGQYLASMHQYGFAEFGLLYEIAAGIPKPDWAAFITSFYDDYGQQAQALGVLPDGVLARIQAVMATMQPLFAAVQQGTFVHGDYHLSNLLQQDGEITSVLDFEWAMSGDPAWDFRIDDQLEIASPGSRDALYAGYSSRRALPDDHAERVSFYRIGLYLDYLVTFSPQDAGEIDRTLPLMMKELAWLESRL